MIKVLFILALISSATAQSALQFLEESYQRKQNLKSAQNHIIVTNDKAIQLYKKKIGYPKFLNYVKILPSYHPIIGVSFNEIIGKYNFLKNLL